MNLTFPKPTLAIPILLLLVTTSVNAQHKLKADLDPFVFLPGAYTLDQSSMAEMFPHPKGFKKAPTKKGAEKNLYFQWLTKERNRAIFKRKPYGNVEVDLTILDGKVPVQEMIIDFDEKGYLGTTISIFNRGDAGKLSSKDFETYFREVGTHLGKQLASRPNQRKGKIERGILTSGFTWISARGMAVLEYNPGVRSQNKKVEFLRMRLCRRDARGAYAAAMNERSHATVRQSELPRNVRKGNGGNIFVNNVPMVDQGGKGYCVVASVQRLFEYYGVPCDMHQLAEIAGADPQRGTSSFETNKQLGSIDHLFKMRYSCLGILSTGGKLHEMEDPDRGILGKEFNKRDFDKAVKKYTQAGIPLLWSLDLGKFKENPPLSEQTSGGHMRLIVGYNDTDEKVLFSDSWGAGHELKSMNRSDAYRATSGLYLMKPVTN